MKCHALGVLLLAMTAGAVAQSVDEQLLAAQMAYQQGDAQLTQATNRRVQAESAKQLADQRLLDAQAAVERSNAELAAAKAAEDAAKQTMDTLTSSLSEAWKRKDAGQ
ncbi:MULTISPECIES: hypothetical protein [unclassified Paludibacterium]|uniref:hypothetical protein n=1 Tax=unclassified Paludibacterium TaxID=2618429 RepID=UPI001C057B1E|nr:hypothetical protein [Paludibacterium sp. B53371]BEV72415.1 hypothetical protein THUN1379_18970 [Paludibacterium sp. THUN1379]